MAIRILSRLPYKLSRTEDTHLGKPLASQTQSCHRLTMTSPGTWRVSDGSPVHFADAVAAWTSAAIPALECVARIYHATITYLDLGEQVQEQSGIRTRMLLMNWIG